jgi:hypothetical protein
VGLAIVDRAGGIGVRHELIVDPATGVLLGEQISAVGSSQGLAAGTLLGWNVYLQRRVVDSLPAGESVGEARGC